jgi:aerobic carbon-monoxide dehydrogenase small subunit
MTLHSRSTESRSRPRSPRASIWPISCARRSASPAHIGCEHGVCGACNVVIDGRSARSCLTLAVQVDGAVVETIEGLTASGAIADLQSEFVRRNALQCGYCTPGVLVTAAELLTRGRATRTEIRDALSGNYCRCTGYHAIVDAIEAVIGRRRGAEP